MANQELHVNLESTIEFVVFNGEAFVNPNNGATHPIHSNGEEIDVELQTTNAPTEGTITVSDETEDWWPTASDGVVQLMKVVEHSFDVDLFGTRPPSK